MEKTEIKTEKYWILVPYLGSYFILYGMFNMTTYYSKFNINILDYVNLSESIAYFFKDIRWVIVFVLMILSLSYLFKIGVNIFKNRNSKEKELVEKLDLEIQEIEMKLKESKLSVENAESLCYEKNNKKQTLSKKLRQRKTIYLLFSCILMIIILILALIEIVVDKANIIFLTLFLISYIIPIYIYFKLRDLRLLIVSATLSMLLASAYNGASINAKTILTGNQTSIKMTINKRLYSSADSCYLIGNTEKYIFIFNKKEHKSIIFPHEEIDSIEIPLK